MGLPTASDYAYTSLCSARTMLSLNQQITEDPDSLRA